MASFARQLLANVAIIIRRKAPSHGAGLKLGAQQCAALIAKVTGATIILHLLSLNGDNGPQA